jgi:hypothetical protein
MTKKIPLVGMFVFFSLASSILADNIAACDALRSAIP